MMNVKLHKRMVAIVQTIAMLLTLVLPITIGAEAATLAAKAYVSAERVYAGEIVDVDVEISGGRAPYAVTLQAVREGTVVFGGSLSADSAWAAISWTPDACGVYELVVLVRDDCNDQTLTAATIAVAEHDAETPADWKKSVSGASVSADWASSLISVARTQVGYAESRKDFVLRNGQRQGYSRYGGWLGTPYADWNIAFVAFVANYAGIPNDVLLSGLSCSSWINGMRGKGTFFAPGSGYVPKAGDIAFLGGGRAAVVESASAGQVSVIEGDVNGEVARKSYTLSQLEGVGNTRLMQGLHTGSATAVPGSPLDNENPPYEPMETPLPEEEELIFQAAATPGPGASAVTRDDRDALDRMSGQMNGLIGELNAFTAAPGQFSDSFGLMLAAFDQFAEKYLKNGETSPEAIDAFVQALTTSELFYLSAEVADLSDAARNLALNEAETIALSEREDAGILLCRSVSERWQQSFQSRAEGETKEFYPLEDENKIQVWVEMKPAELDDPGTGWATAEMENGAVTISVAGLKSWTKQASTVNIKITNHSAESAEIGFAWTGVDVNTLTMNGTAVPDKTQGIFSGEVAANESVSMKITTGKDNTTNTLVLKDFSYRTNAAAAPAVMICCDDQKGHVLVEDTVYRNNGTLNTEAATLIAVPDSGMAFVGWFTSEDQLISADAQLYIEPKEDMVLHALFAEENAAARFLVNDMLYEDLSQADAAATAAGGAVIVLLNNGSLTGSHTISAGNTLLIPFDAACTLYAAAPQSVSGTFAPPEIFRTLTLEENAALTILGSMSLSAQHHAAEDGQTTAGAPTGPISAVVMNGGSSIHVGNGGKLYAWGRITGSGRVTAESGAVVCENYQVADYRGAAATASMIADADKGVFPISQYALCNIEVPLTLYAGAQEYGYTSYLAEGTLCSSRIPFIGSSGMFCLETGQLTKECDDSGRMTLTLVGQASVAPFVMEIGGQTVQTSNFSLPIHGGMTIRAAENSVLQIEQDTILLAGSQLIVDSGASCTLNGNAKLCLDAADLLVNGALDASNGQIWAAEGGNIRSDGAGRVLLHAADENPLVYMAAQTGDEVVYQEIPASLPPLTNQDGSTVVFPADGCETVTFLYADGCWNTRCHVTTAPVDERSGVVIDAQTGKNVRHYLTVIGENASYDSIADAWVSDRCDAIGSYTMSCPCAAMNTEALPANEKPHTATELPAVAATCTEDGLTAGAVCAECGVVLSEQAVVLAAHTWQKGMTRQDPTCSDDGFQIMQCAVPGCGAMKTVTIPATGHTESVSARAEPSCESAGLTEGTACSVCGEVLTAQEIIPATGHTVVIQVAVPGTCTTNGLTEGQYCTTCGKVLAEQVVIPAAHTWQESDLHQEATCTEAGFQTMQCAVPGCDATENVTISATGHTEAILVKIEPTCENIGLTAGTVCSVCGEVLQAQEIVPATGHTAVIQNAVAPTCTADGLTEGQYCSVCNEVLIAQQTIPAAHTWQKGMLHQEATCTKAGYQLYICGVSCCGATETVTIPATGHTERVFPRVEPSCESTGLTEGTACSVCGEVMTAQEIIPATGHTVVIQAAVPATCTTNGLTEGQYCTTCGKVLAEQVVIPAAHTWQEGDTRQEATCTEEGFQTMQCAVPGCEATENVTIPATGHTESILVKIEPTCENIGLTAGTVCSVCGEVLQAQEIVPATGHTAVIQNAVAPTCTTDGLTEGQYCSVCNEVLIAQQTIPAAHSWQKGMLHQDATCTKTGYQLYICGVSGCGATEMVTIPENGHTVVVVPGIEGTCEQEGLTEGSRCSVCGEVLVAQVPIPGGHRWNKAPCCNPDAVCLRCGLSLDGLLPHDLSEATCETLATCQYEGCSGGPDGTPYVEGSEPGHLIVETGATPASCEQEGRTAGQTCSRCGEVIAAVQVIPATGHDMVTYPAKRPTFTAPGWDAYEACTACGKTTKADIPALGEQRITDYADFLEALPWLEQWAASYGDAASETDPVTLTVQYICTGGNDDFAAYIRVQEDLLNAECETADGMIPVHALNSLQTLVLPNGETADFAHLFSVLNILCQSGDASEAEAAGWAGALVDLMQAADQHPAVSDASDLEGAVTVILNELLLGGAGISPVKLRGGMDAFFLQKNLGTADLTALFSRYFTAFLDDRARAAYMLAQRFGGVNAREAIRSAVYSAYSGSSAIAALESGHSFASADLTQLRKAVCYAFADYLQKKAGVQSGWYEEAGGYRYYIAGVPLTGVQLAEGLFYDFGTDGVNPGKTPYTGHHALNGKPCYIQEGSPYTGWIELNDGWYCYDDAGAGLEGTVSSGFDGILYQFDGGRLISGVWHQDGTGWMYFYGPERYEKGWQTIDGERYFFEDGYAVTGVRPVQDGAVQHWYAFDDKGACRGNAEDGFYWWQDRLYYVENDGDYALANKLGLYQVGEDYYYALYGGHNAVDQSCYVTELNGLPFDKGWYQFDGQGRMMIRLPGDADDNGAVDVNDAVIVMSYASGAAVTINLYNADVDGDHQVTADDGLLLMQYCSGWPVELI